MAAVVTLGLGIGACTAIYTVVHSVLMAPLPYPEPDRLVHLWQIHTTGNRNAFSDPNFEDVRNESRSFQAVAQYSGARAVVAGGTAPARARVAIVSRDLPAVLRVAPAHGRWFVPDEQQPNGRPAAVVSHTFWQQYLAGDVDLSRRTLTYDGRTYAVVGVMPADARFPQFTADLWVPRELSPALPSRTAHNWRVIARLRDGVTVEQARADLRAIAAELKRRHGDRTWMVDAAVVPLHEDLVGQSRTGLLVLLAGAAFLLVIACANVVNLLVTRAAGRQREVAVRAALGANRPTLLLPFVMEAVLIAAAGSAAGLLVANAGVKAWIALGPRVARLDEIRMSWPVLIFAIGVAGTSALVMGLLAGWQVTRLRSTEELRSGTRSTGGSATARLRGALVTVQIATSMALLVGAGLLTRSVHRLLDQDPGFRTEHVVTMELLSPRSEDDGALAHRAALQDEILARLRSLPGVVAAGGVNAFPMSGGANGRFAVLSPAAERIVEGAIERCGARRSTCPRAHLSELFERLFTEESKGEAEFRVASDGYFRAMGIPLLRGRLFDERDQPDAPHVAVISESLANQRWPGRDPVGARIEFGNMDGDITPFTIIGVVGDLRDGGLHAPPRPTFYGNFRQRPAVTSTFTVAIHATVEPGALVSQARDIVREIAPDVPPQFGTIQQVLTRSIADRRVMMVLLVSFAGIALTIAAIGIYGAISRTVAQRIPEIGVRLALGATPADVRRLVIAQGLRFAVAGLCIGFIVALASTQTLRSLLFGIVPTDPVTYAAVSVLLIAVVTAAAYFPARRATGVDPVVALRAE